MMKRVVTALTIAVMAAVFLAACGSGPAGGAESGKASGDSQSEISSSTAPAQEGKDAAGSGKTGGTQGSGKTGGTQGTEETGGTQGAGEKAQESDDSLRRQLVMVDGKLYAGTGYEAGMLKCGTADGIIHTQVALTQVPTRDDESNFCKDVKYQLGWGDCIILFLPEGDLVFQDVNADTDTMPSVVPSFDATVEEAAADTSEIRVKVTYVDDTSGLSKDFVDSELIVALDTATVPIEPKVGDHVRIWFSGAILESLPAQIGAYRVEVLEGA